MIFFSKLQAFLSSAYLIILVVVVPHFLPITPLGAFSMSSKGKRLIALFN